MPEIDFSRIKVIIGLGNPGDEYAGTYHNVGRALELALLDKTASVNACDHKLKKSPSRKFEFAKAGNFFFAIPLAMMNRSGTAAAEALRFFKAEPRELAVIHDDSDLGIGSFKMSFGRGSAGHRGVESVIKSLGTKDFWRIRIGVREEKKNGSERFRNREKAGEFVLKKITARNGKKLLAVFDAVERILAK